MNSDMVKPEKFGHLHLVYHFTVPLSKLPKKKYIQMKYKNRKKKRKGTLSILQ